MVANAFTKHKDYLIRRAHVADIREPLVKAVYYHRQAQAVARETGGFPSDPDAREVWERDVEDVMRFTKERERILAKLRSDRHTNRQLERLSDAPLKLHEVAA